MKSKSLISAGTKLRVVATNKKTFKEEETIMTFADWSVLQKSSKFYYKAYQV